MKIILEVLIQGWMYWHYSLPTLPERKTFVSRSNRPPLYRGTCSQLRTVLVLVGRLYSCMNSRPYPSLPEEEHIQPSKRVDGREGVLDTDIDCFCVLLVTVSHVWSKLLMLEPTQNQRRTENLQRKKVISFRRCVGNSNHQQSSNIGRSPLLSWWLHVVEVVDGGTNNNHNNEMKTCKKNRYDLVQHLMQERKRNLASTAVSSHTSIPNTQCTIKIKANMFYIKTINKIYIDVINTVFTSVCRMPTIGDILILVLLSTSVFMVQRCLAPPGTGGLALATMSASYFVNKSFLSIATDFLD